jgi:hypothetical protein
MAGRRPRLPRCDPCLTLASHLPMIPSWKEPPTALGAWRSYRMQPHVQFVEHCGHPVPLWARRGCLPVQQVQGRRLLDLLPVPRHVARNVQDTWHATCCMTRGTDATAWLHGCMPCAAQRRRVLDLLGRSSRVPFSQLSMQHAAYNARAHTLRRGAAHTVRCVVPGGSVAFCIAVGLRAALRCVALRGVALGLVMCACMRV